MAQLPARLSGLGLLSHAACSPDIPAAAAENADVIVDAIFGLEGPSECELRSLGERCKAMFSADAEALMETLGESKRKMMMIESASTVRRKWLSTIPYYQPLRLSDLEVASELHKRMLAEIRRPI